MRSQCIFLFEYDDSTIMSYSWNTSTGRSFVNDIYFCLIAISSWHLYKYSSYTITFYRNVKAICLRTYICKIDICAWNKKTIDIKYIVHIVFILLSYHLRSCSFWYFINISFYFIIQWRRTWRFNFCM
jgi:hypothetical protein